MDGIDQILQEDDKNTLQMIGVKRTDNKSQNVTQERQ